VAVSSIRFPKSPSTSARIVTRVAAAFGMLLKVSGIIAPGAEELMSTLLVNVPHRVGLAVGRAVGCAVGRAVGRAVDGRAVDGRAVDGRAVDGRAVDGRAVDGRAVDGCAVDGRAVDGRAVDGRAVDGRAVDGLAVGRKVGRLEGLGLGFGVVLSFVKSASTSLPAAPMIP
jgi:hypothetical protein